MNKPERLRAIIRDAQLLSEMSKSDPHIFNKVISEKDLEKLTGLTSDLVANVEKQVNDRDDISLDRLDLDSQTT